MLFFHATTQYILSLFILNTVIIRIPHINELPNNNYEDIQDIGAYIKNMDVSYETVEFDLGKCIIPFDFSTIRESVITIGYR